VVSAVLGLASPTAQPRRSKATHSQRQERQASRSTAKQGKPSDQGRKPTMQLGRRSRRGSTSSIHGVVIDDYIYLRALDEHIALDFSWTLRRFPLEAHACYLDYQDSRCRCRIIVERPDLLTGAELPREWLQIVDGLGSEATIDAIIALVNQVVHWDQC